MAAGVMRDARRPELIDTAGMELDRTLLVFDYLNGEPLAVLDGPVADPIGPSGAAAAFCARTPSSRRAASTRSCLRTGRTSTWSCACAGREPAAGWRPRARGTHEHSATLGSGSARKNYLVGYGRGYMLRKWGVLSPRRLPGVLARELTLIAGQAVVDRNLGGARGRLRGLRAASAPEPYPSREALPDPPSLARTLRRRWRRRRLLRRGAS